MTTAIKLCALERLGEVIEREVTALRGRVCAGPSDRAHRRVFPNLAIVPETFTFQPWESDPVDPRTGLDREPTPGTTIHQVGEWIGQFRLELGAAEPKTRAVLEELVERAFLSGAGSAVDPLYPDAGKEMRSGAILIDAADCYGARMAFLLSEDSWSQEMAFGDEWFSIMRVDVELPALVPRYKVGRIRDLRLYLTEDMQVISSPAALPADAQKVRINADGSIAVIP